MEYIVVALVAVFVILMVSYPLSGRQRQLYSIEDVIDPGDTKQLDYLNSKQASIANNIRELDFEHEMGKLSEQDYTALRQGYEAESNRITAAIDKLRIKKEIENLIEEEVRSRRRIR